MWGKDNLGKWAHAPSPSPALRSRAREAKGRGTWRLDPLVLLWVTADTREAGLLLDAPPAELGLVQTVLALPAVPAHAPRAAPASRGPSLLARVLFPLGDGAAQVRAGLQPHAAVDGAPELVPLLPISVRWLRRRPRLCGGRLVGRAHCQAGDSRRCRKSALALKAGLFADALPAELGFIEAVEAFPAVFAPARVAVATSHCALALLLRTLPLGDQVGWSGPVRPRIGGGRGGEAKALPQGGHKHREGRSFGSHGGGHSHFRRSVRSRTKSLLLLLRTAVHWF